MSQPEQFIIFMLPVYKALSKHRGKTVLITQLELLADQGYRVLSLTTLSSADDGDVFVLVGEHIAYDYSYDDDEQLATEPEPESETAQPETAPPERMRTPEIVPSPETSEPETERPSPNKASFDELA